MFEVPKNEEMVWVQATALPARSSTEKCVVEGDSSSAFCGFEGARVADPRGVPAGRVGSLAEVDLHGAQPCVALVDVAALGNEGIGLGITHPAALVQGGQDHGLLHDVDGQWIVPAHEAEVEVFEDVQRGEDARSADRAAGHAQFITAVAALDRLFDQGAIGLQVGLARPAAIRLHEAVEIVGQHAAVIGLDSLFSDDPQRAGQCRIAVGFTHRPGQALVEEFRCVGGQVLPGFHGQHGEGFVDLEAVLRQADGGFDQDLEWQRGVVHGLGHASRQASHAVALGGVLDIGQLAGLVQPCVGRQRRRRAAKIDGHFAAVGERRHQVAFAAEAGSIRRNHTQCEADGNGCIDGIAALLQYFRPGLRRQWMGGSHHARL